MKMEKTPRYTQRERNMVLGFAAQYKDVIENKRTDAESNRKKDEVWRQISREFNSRVYHQRSAKQLRQLYKNMKLLLKKDLCGEGKGNRSFMDLLNTLSQQESVNQYISEQMSPGGYSNSQQQKYDDDYDDSKMPSVGYDGVDSDVILIKSEDISDNEQSQNGGNDDIMDDDDDDDCLSPKDIPEVCLEEEDDEIFATDLRQTPIHHERQHGQQIQNENGSQNHQPEISIQSVGGGIRVANMKSLQNSSTSNSHNNSNNSNTNSALCISNTKSNLSNSGASSSINNSLSGIRQTSAEQAQQALLLNGLGLSAVHQPPDSSSAAVAIQPHLPTLQRGITHQSVAANINGHVQGANSFMHLNGQKQTAASVLGNFSSAGIGHGNGGSGNNSSNNRNDYLMSLAIEERKRKIDLLNAQIEYWQTLTKKLDSNTSHNQIPPCACFPGMQTPTSSS